MSADLWRINSVTMLLEAIEHATRSAPAPVVLADAGVENVNARVDGSSPK
jgi:hypothetical protein